MIDFRTLAENRYTTKKYDSSRKIPESQIEDLKHILKLSPSSINSQPWSYTIVSRKETKDALAEASFFNAPKIKDASHLVVFSVMDNLEQFERHVEKNLAEGSVNYYKQFIKEQPAEKTINWLTQQVYLSLGFFLAACAAMEIDSTPMEGIEPQKYKEILNITHQKVLFAVAIGYRDSEDANQPSITEKSRLTIDDVVTSID
ncbi:nitroreductase family protein [Maribacter sp. X9]|uniref:nitroreductase family protein n=1 Tax=Maribacter sp. X9 TaxID=3402159 RepID=UPI003AF3788A